MSFGRRLAPFFVLIAIVPTAALIAILLFVSGDSQRGKADARLAAGLQTALAVYRERTDDARARAHALARQSALASAIRGDTAMLESWAVARALRFDHEVSLIILDVDDFKQIDDRQHLQGDIVCSTGSRTWCGRRRARSTWPPATGATSWR